VLKKKLNEPSLNIQYSARFGLITTLDAHPSLLTLPWGQLLIKQRS
jgi:hypothetical protein